MRDKREKFVELAEKRVNNILKQLELVGNLGNKSNYEYTEEDYRKMFQVIDKGIRQMKKRFEDTGSDGKKFKL